MYVGNYVILKDVIKNKFVIASLRTFCVVQSEDS